MKADLEHILYKLLLNKGKEMPQASEIHSQTLTVESCNRTWTLHRPADLESLWQSITEEEFNPDERLPYWVELWPASLALANLLEENKARITAKTCLDLGCGIGFTALVASSLGAKVIGMDYEHQALQFAKKNAVENKVHQPLWTVMDWRFPALVPQSCDFIFGGDIMYERRFVEPVFEFLSYALAKDGIVWLAEPSRNVYALFQEKLTQHGWKSVCVSQQKVAPLHVQKNMVSVKLWELSRAKA